MNDYVKYFFEKSLELLSRSAFDSYRVSLHNPYTIFKELNESIEKFNKNRIKNFDPTITSIGNEAYGQLSNTYVDEVLNFNSFNINDIKTALKEKCYNKGNKGEFRRSIKLLSKSILNDNQDFLTTLLSKIEDIINSGTNNNYVKLDRFSSWLITQMIHEGYSRKFIKNQLFHYRRKLYSERLDIPQVFNGLRSDFIKEKEIYEVVFKLKSNSINSFKTTNLNQNILSSLSDFHNEQTRYISQEFKGLEDVNVFLKINIKAHDYWSALKKAFINLSETIEINHLHHSSQHIVFEKKALVYRGVNLEHYRMESVEEYLDGHYEYVEESYIRFLTSFSSLDTGSVAREKLKSAIRFYKLGNESIELEHKVLNYWIGFEQLFSSVDSNEDSIRRMKDFFIKMNCCYYLNRRIKYLLESLERREVFDNGDIISLDNLFNIDVNTFEFNNSLISIRLKKYLTEFKDNKNIKKVIELHKSRLEQHLTRIYKIRNELVHEGRTSTDLNLIVGHLRHYLIFSIEQITNELYDNSLLGNLDDVFVFYENLYEKVRSSNTLLQVYNVKEYNGYMQ